VPQKDFRRGWTLTMAGSGVNPDVELRIQPLGLKAHSMFKLKNKN